MSFLNKCLNTRVLVVGDVILDEYVFGSVDRISPEAPVPIVREERIEHRMGGAANVAANIVSLGGKVELVGYVSQDESGFMLYKKCREIGVYPTFVNALDKTICKVRIMSGRHQMLRIDRDDPQTISSDSLKEILTRIESLAPSVDVIVVSDYAKGVVCEEVMSKLKSFNKKIVVDPKPKHFSLYNDVFLITPNKKESIELAKVHEEEFVSLDVARILFEKFNCNVLITLGAEGMYLLEKSDGVVVGTNFLAVAEEVFDVTGAGDTVVACMALAIASGFDLSTSCKISNAAAGISVGHLGAVAVTAKELGKVINI